MYPNIVVQLLFVINCLIFISYGEVLNSQQCKPVGTTWTENGTEYRSLLYRKELHAYAVCKVGYTLSSSSKILCVNGLWENPLPRCERITSRQCEPLPTVKIAIRKCENEPPSEGSICRYRCPRKYYLIGSSERRCGQNLRWTGVEPRCILEYSHTIKAINPATAFDYSHYNRRQEKISPNNNNEPQTCDINNGGCEQICNSSSGFPVCSCRNGFRPERGGKCQDIDECQFPHLNQCNQKCLNTPGSYSCSCESGYILKNSYECEEIKANKRKSIFHVPRYNYKEERGDIANKTIKPKTCDINNGGCEQICNSSSGFAVCSCKEGYRRLQDGRCMDIDECQFPHLNQCNQKCINTPGSYSCSCESGYILKNSYECEDIDECQFPHLNQCNQKCFNTPGSYSCSCESGYILKNRYKCEDIDECQFPHLNQCSQKCINTPGSYSCLCESGYILSNRYECEDIDECQFPHLNQCNQKCFNTPGSYSCSCESGYILKNRYKCEDIDECQFPYLNQCNHKCINTPGGYSCSCKSGYILKNSYECEGCRKNSYSSEIYNICIECPPDSVTDSNAKSSIADCRCLPGFIGSPPHNIPCRDINECLIKNFGCSHSCINTPGSALCSCPPGFELKDDNKTCVDIDECQIKNGGCQMFCHNSIRSFHCSCSSGYTLAKDNYSCMDNDECADGNNGGCSDICNNFPGGHYCSCRKGFRLDIEGKTCLGSRCLSVAVPHHSSLHCKAANKTKVISKPHDYSSQNPPDYPFGTICKVKCGRGFQVNTSSEVIECLEDGNWNATTPQCIASHCPSLMIPDNGDVYPPTCKDDFIPVKQQCYFTCKPGYEMFGGKSVIKCKYNLTWTDDPPSCIPVYKPPSIICPDDITVELSLNESSSNLSIPQPITNMENVEIYPDWIRLEQPIPFPSGKTNVLFKVRNADSNVTSQCIMTINVIDTESPVFVMCPESFSVSDVGYQGVLVTWSEPAVTDNVAIHSVVKNLDPNSTLNAGVHFVEYTAKDAAGNSATCAFQINITRGHCKDLNDPENGRAVCMDWLMGRLCRPACNPGFSRDPDEPKFFACSDSRKWTPSNTISPCFSVCSNGTEWSAISQSCEEE
nr:fibrillin-1 isoform X2 [Parasteatoda tepidariorum]